MLFENGALIGVVVAFVGICASRATGSAYPDTGASIVIGLLLVIVAYFLIRESKGLLLGESVSPRVAREMRAVVSETGAVEEILELLTIQTAPNEVLVLMDARFREGLSTPDVVAAIGKIEHALQARFPDVTRIFIESQRVTARRPP